MHVPFHTVFLRGSSGDAAGCRGGWSRATHDFHLSLYQLSSDLFHIVRYHLLESSTLQTKQTRTKTFASPATMLRQLRLSSFLVWIILFFFPLVSLSHLPFVIHPPYCSIVIILQYKFSPSICFFLYTRHLLPSYHL